MIRFSVCVETIFRDLLLADRIAKAAECGASAIEFWRWQDKDLDTIARTKEAKGVNVAAFCAFSDATPNDPAAAKRAAQELLLAVGAAKQIGAAGLIVVAGRQLEGVPRDKQLEAVAQVLAAAAPDAEKAHVNLLLEPLNARQDHPGTLPSTTADTLRVLDLVNQPNVKMLFDVYHQYITEGSVLGTIEKVIGRIGHFHLADVPGHGEPGTGALDFAEILRLIDSLGYGGYVGLEFHPSGDHVQAVKKAMNLV